MICDRNLHFSGVAYKTIEKPFTPMALRKKGYWFLADGWISKVASGQQLVTKGLLGKSYCKRAANAFYGVALNGAADLVE